MVKGIMGEAKQLRAGENTIRKVMGSPISCESKGENGLLSAYKLLANRDIKSE
jgi:hypothetical protein